MGTVLSALTVLSQQPGSFPALPFLDHIEHAGHQFLFADFHGQWINPHLLIDGQITQRVASGLAAQVAGQPRAGSVVPLPGLFDGLGHDLLPDGQGHGLGQLRQVIALDGAAWPSRTTLSTLLETTVRVAMWVTHEIPRFLPFKRRANGVVFRRQLSSPNNRAIAPASSRLLSS